jgi:hypothetical protein
MSRVSLSAFLELVSALMHAGPRVLVSSHSSRVTVPSQSMVPFLSCTHATHGSVHSVALALSPEGRSGKSLANTLAQNVGSAQSFDAAHVVAFPQSRRRRSMASSREVSRRFSCP